MLILYTIGFRVEGRVIGYRVWGLGLSACMGLSSGFYVRKDFELGGTRVSYLEVPGT